VNSRIAGAGFILDWSYELLRDRNNIVRDKQDADDIDLMLFPKVCIEQTYSLYHGHKEEHLYNNLAELFLPECIPVPYIIFIP
jgi:hypothetical protein